MKKALFPILGFICLAAAVAAPQQAPPPASRALGVVDAIDPASGQITLHTDAGPVLKVVSDPRARFLRIPPGETSLTKGSPITAADIATGDRVLARGQLSDDKASLTATLIVVMTKTDIAKKQQADKAEWQKRGVGGVVKAVDASAGNVTITVRSADGPKPLVIQAGPKTSIRRYAPDSVKFADTKTGTIAEIKPGDQVRALGEKSADGGTFAAEEIVSGAFRNVAATITAVDAANNIVKVTDLATKKPLIVHINADSQMHKLPEMVARMIATRASGGAAGQAPGGGANGPGATPPASAPAGNGAPGGPGGGMRGGRSGDLQQMLERLPSLTLADLKAGDAIIVSSTEGVDAGQVSAITLIAGVEPILAAAPAGSQRAAAMLGTWNLDMSSGGGVE